MALPSKLLGGVPQQNCRWRTISWPRSAKSPYPTGAGEQPGPRPVRGSSTSRQARRLPVSSHPADTGIAKLDPHSFYALAGATGLSLPPAAAIPLSRCKPRRPGPRRTGGRRARGRNSAPGAMPRPHSRGGLRIPGPGAGRAGAASRKIASQYVHYIFQVHSLLMCLYLIKFVLLNPRDRRYGMYCVNTFFAAIPVNAYVSPIILWRIRYEGILPKLYGVWPGDRL